MRPYPPKCCNCDDAVVNGSYDLEDLFPLALDLKPFLDKWGTAGLVYELAFTPDPYCGAPGRVLGWALTELGKPAAGSYQTAACCTFDGHPLTNSTLNALGGGAAAGLGSAALGFLASDVSAGVLAVEGRNASRGTVEVRVRHGADEVFRSRLPLRSSSVRDFYRWFNFRHATGGSEDRETDLWEPSNNPDAESNGKSVIFVHGFRVGESDAEDWSATVFKRLWWSGSHAKFYGVAWQGDDDGGSPPSHGALNYHGNVVNAFNTASNFAAAVSALSGEKTVIAHSLGNMVVSSAIQDWGLDVAHYFMCDAAVPSEAYTPAAFDPSLANVLVHDDWRAYTNRTWTSCWHLLFDSTTDDRGKLTWRGRFASVAVHPGVVNFYSSGDEVFELYSSTPNALQGMDVSLGWYSWHKQESAKGRVISNDVGMKLFLSDWCGWGFRSTVVTNADESLTYTPACSVADANGIAPACLVTNTVFNPSPVAMFTNTIPYVVRDEILARGIPALSPAAGNTNVSTFGVQRNCDVYQDLVRPNGWGRSVGLLGERWLHSDMIDMALFFNQALFGSFVERGELR